VSLAGFQFDKRSEIWKGPAVKVPDRGYEKADFSRLSGAGHRNRLAWMSLEPIGKKIATRRPADPRIVPKKRITAGRVYAEFQGRK
jgi:hypothetical protein